MHPTQRAETMYKRFRSHPEWLLIKVTRMDNRTNKTLSGILLDHSPDRDAVYKKMMDHKLSHKDCKDVLSIEYSNPRLPKDVALIFYAQI